MLLLLLLLIVVVALEVLFFVFELRLLLVGAVFEFEFKLVELEEGDGIVRGKNKSSGKMTQQGQDDDGSADRAETEASVFMVLLKGSVSISEYQYRPWCIIDFEIVVSRNTLFFEIPARIEASLPASKSAGFLTVVLDFEPLRSSSGRYYYIPVHTSTYVLFLGGGSFSRLPSFFQT